MRIDLPLRIRVGFAIIGITLLGAISTVVVYYGNGYFDDGYRVSAVFDQSSQGLDTQSDVKLRGINVGTVDGIKLLPDGSAEVILFVNRGARIPDSATASIEPLSIFGPKFVRLDPGEHELDGPYLAAGDRITRTVAPVELTQVLANATRLLQDIDPQELVTIIQSVADGVGGLGPEIGRSVDNLTAIVDVAARHTGDAERFLGDIAALVATLADHGDELVASATNLHDVLPELATRSDQLGALLDATARVSADVADLLEGHAAAVDTTVAGLADVVANLYRHRDQIPDLISGLDAFFGVLADILRLPGPEGTLVGALRGLFSTDPCQLFGRLCATAATAGSDSMNRMLATLFPGGTS